MLLAIPAKGKQTNKKTTPYSDWHRTLDRSLYMVDIDGLQVRYIDGRLCVVGVIEETSVRDDHIVNDTYLNNIVWRYNNRDLQGTVVRKVANALDTKAYIVLYRNDLSKLWVYGLTGNTGWTEYSQDEYEQFLLNLKPGRD